MASDINGRHARRFLDGVVATLQTQEVAPNNKAQLLQRLSTAVKSASDAEVVEYVRMPWLKLVPGLLPTWWQLASGSFRFQPVGNIPNVGELDGALYVYAPPVTVDGQGFRYIGLGAHVGVSDNLIYLRFSGNEPKAKTNVPHELILVPRTRICHEVEKLARPSFRHNYG